METEGGGTIRSNFHDAVVAILTVEEGIEIVVVDFAEFEKVLACFWASIYF